MKRKLIIAACAISALLFFGGVISLLLPGGSTPDQHIGKITTNYYLNPLKPNDDINIDRFDDPKVSNISCYMSRAQVGGWESYVGTQEDPSKFSVICKQINVHKTRVCITESFKQGEKMASERASMWFKTVDIYRFLDAKAATINYVAVSRKVVEGSHDNSISGISYDPECSKL